MAWYNLYRLAFKMKFSWLHKIGVFFSTTSEDTSFFINWSFDSLDPREFQDTMQNCSAFWLESEPSCPSPALALGSWQFPKAGEPVLHLKGWLDEQLLPAGWILRVVVVLQPPASASSTLGLADLYSTP